MAGIKLLKKTPQNLNYIVNHLVNPDAKKYLFDDFYGYTEISSVLYSPVTFIYGIFSKGEPEPKGAVFFTSAIPYRSADLYGIIFDKSLRGKGLIKEVTEKIENDIRRRIHLKSVSASIIGKNDAVEHILGELGFEKIGVKKKYIVTGGKYKDVNIYYKVFKE